MSRIGKKVIAIPEKTEVTVDGSIVTVTGPHGTLTRTVSDSITVNVSDNEVSFVPADDSIATNALWGTTASHVTNMIAGVNQPYEKKLEIEGVGYRAEMKGNDIVLNVGFSHPVELKAPEGVATTVEKNLITVTGIDKEKVGQFAAEIRATKKPEPYKGKGIHYVGEYIRRKEGKKAV
jgi:large subunit ribosomal protein L6